MGTKTQPLTTEERELIQLLKEDLKNIGVPREEWAFLIQQEINGRRKEQHKETRRKKNKENPGPIRKQIQNILSKITQTITNKIADKGMQNMEDMQEGDMEELLHLINPSNQKFDSNSMNEIEMVEMLKSMELATENVKEADREGKEEN